MMTIATTLRTGGFQTSAAVAAPAGKRATTRA